MKYYEDGGLDKCASNNQRSPGCVNLCQLHYEPVSLCTFWMTSLKAVMLPFVLFRMLLNFVRVKNQYRVSQTGLLVLTINSIINRQIETCHTRGSPVRDHCGGQTIASICGANQLPYVW